MKSAKQLVSEANEQIETLTAEEAIKLTAMKTSSLSIYGSLRSGKGFSPGAVHVPRGLLEFQVDTSEPFS